MKATTLTKGATKETLFRVFRSLRFGMAVGFGLIFLIVGVYTRLFSNQALPKEYSYADLWFHIYTYAHYALALPILAVMPFSDRLAIERSEGFLRSLVFRSGFRPYVRERFFVNAIASAVAPCFRWSDCIFLRIFMFRAGSIRLTSGIFRWQGVHMVC